MSLGKIHLTFYESTKLSPKVPAPLCRPPPPATLADPPCCPATSICAASAVNGGLSDRHGVSVLFSLASP